jgi:hypothetical protein
LLGASLLAQAVLPGSAAFAEGPAPQKVLEENTSYNDTGVTAQSASNGYSGFNPFYEKESEPNDLTEHNQRYTLIGGEHFVFSGSINGHENDSKRSVRDTGQAEPRQRPDVGGRNHFAF